MRVRLVTRPVVVLFLALLGSAVQHRAAYAQEAKGPIRMCVVTEQASSTEFVDPEEHQRRDSTKDLQGQLKFRSKLKVVDADEHPEVQIEVLGRDRNLDGGSTTVAAPLFGAAIAATQPTTSTELRVRLTVVGRNYSTVIVGRGKSWKDAAGDVARTIETWAKDNYGRLRPPAKN